MPKGKVLVVAQRLNPYPPPETLPQTANAKKYWRSFSNWQWAIIQGLLNGLLQEILWEEMTDEIYGQITEMFLPETPVCEEPEKPPPAAVVPTKGGSTSGVGITGLTYDELEDFYMSWSLRGQQAWVNGTLCYWSEGCCDWVPVEVISGIAPTGSISPPSGMTYEEWEAAGFPPTADIENLGNVDQGLLATDDAAKCAKATAIVEQIWHTMDVWVGVVNDFPEDMMTVSGFAGLLTAFFPVVSIPLTIIGAIFAYLLGTPAADIVARLEAAIAKEDEKQELICDLVPRMATPIKLNIVHLNKMSDNDIKIAFERFNDIVQPHSDVMKLLKFFPVTEWKEITAQRSETESCGCADFLPYQYTPPSQVGSIQFETLIYTGALGVNPLSYLAGQPFELLQTGSPHGQTIINGSAWRSIYAGADTAFGQENKYTRLGFLVEFPALLQIDSILYDADIIGVPAGSIWQALQGWVALYNSGSGWSSQSLHSEQPLVDAINLGGNVTLGEGTFMALAWRTANTNAELYAVINNLRFTGVISGQGFLNKKIGEVLT